ncbi:probable cytochrome P450 9h1 [Drosophila tropicalis]|uniref:probable cytochrome P450 9h1 n=1 Tax=Drosophila tropicalis TaxID=46794 RepID=UPI0035AB8850
MIDQHMEFKGSKVYGVYALRDPLIFLRDSELIKLVGIQKFDYFVNHNAMHNNMNESILSKSLISLRNEQWREMRNILTPAFTGSKLRAMYELLQECSAEAVQHIQEQLPKAQDGAIELEMRDFFTCYANDVIATVAFGVKVNSFRRKDNEFFRIGQSLTVFNYKSMTKAVLFALMPRIMRLLKVQVMDPKVIDYFKSLVLVAMKYRQEHNVIRPDMIHLLMEAKRLRSEDLKKENQNDSKHWYSDLSDDDLLAQCLLFFFAGYGIISTALCFLTYELCMNQDVQKNLYEEILSVQQDLAGNPLSYEDIKRMKYLDMVIMEGLRKWPPAISTDRECSKDIDLKDENGQVLFAAKAGDVLQIPIFAIHHDPEHFEEPEKFDPERFSNGVNPFTYLPFGLGPRNCIGNRLALMELKLIIYQLVLNFKLMPAEKTVSNMLKSVVGHNLQPKEGFWLKFQPHTH